MDAEAELERARDQLDDANRALASERAALAETRSALAGVASSASWRLTAPLRAAKRVLRGRRSATEDGRVPAPAPVQPAAEEDGPRNRSSGAADEEAARPRGGWASHPLWNDPDYGYGPPLAAPAELPGIEGEDPGSQRAAIERGVEALGPTAQREALRESGVEAVREALLSDPFPLPTRPQREDYCGDNHLAYWLFGLGDALMLRRLAEELKVPLDAGRWLDFGCASGRVMRHLAYLLPEVDIHGVDLGRHNVEWARQHLASAVTVAHGSVLPTLPYPDRSINTVFAGSVFTHTGDFEEAWLLELRRVLRPSGFALVTIVPERTWSMLRDPEDPLTQLYTSMRHRADPMRIEPVTHELFEGSMPAGRVVMVNLEQPVTYAVHVIHSDSWIRQRWGRLFEIERVIQRAHDERQDAVLLRPRESEG